MAFPVILVDSTNGAASDTACSGAGPTTAKTGTLAAINTNTTVNITDVVDLSGVAVDGSACLYVADTTAGDRRFARITNITGGSGAWVVTTAEAYSRTTTGLSWAIGGVRATIYGTVSTMLIDNNSAAGDAMPGWIIEMQSGHGESIASGAGPLGIGRIILRRSGNTTSGPITIRGAAGAATLPLLTAGVDGVFIEPFGEFWVLQGFEIRNNNASKTASVAISNGSSSNGGGTSDFVLVRGVKISHATNFFWKGVQTANKWTIMDCEIGFTSSHAIETNYQYFGPLQIFNNFIHDTGGNGLTLGTIGYWFAVVANVFYKCSIGIALNQSSALYSGGYLIAGNTIDSCTASGIDVTVDGVDLGNMLVVNNILSNNGGYGLKFSNVAHTAAYLSAYQIVVTGNNTYNNTSGAYLPASYGTNDPGLNPTYTSASGGDFSIGTNLKAKGYPLGGTLPVGTTSSTYSYVDPGAAQRQEAGGGGGLVAQITGARSIGTY